MQGVLARAREGLGSAVLITADAGVGKSRLIAELEIRARAAGGLVLVGECVPIGDGELPYAPLVGAVRALVRARGTVDIDATGPRGRALIAGLLPELTMDEGPPTASSQVQLFEALSAAFAAAAQTTPVVLVVEDIHWSDRSTRDFLTFLIRRARHEPVGLVVSCRSDELRRDGALRQFVLELERSGHASRIELAPFNRSELADQVEAILGRPPDHAVVAQLLARSEGNAFFTEELIAFSDGAGGLPDSMREAFLLRVEQQPAAVQHLLRVAAVAGRRVDHALLESLPGYTDADLSPVLRAAIAADVLVTVEDPDGYAFRHALMREAIYADLLPGQRRALHLEVARAIEAANSSLGADATYAAELAYHFCAAGQLGDGLIASVNAGVAAEALHAFDEALIQYTRALELWDRAAPADLPVGRLDVLWRAAAAADFTGRFGDAVEINRAALAMIDEDVDPVSAGLTRARLGRFLWRSGQPDAALTELRRAVELIPADPSTEQRAFVLAAEAGILMVTHHFAEALERCKEALSVARQVGAESVEAQVLNTMCPLHDAAWDFVGAVAAAEDARRIAVRLGLADEVGRSYINGAMVLYDAGRVDDALACSDEWFAVAGDLGVDLGMGEHERCATLWRLVSTGRWPEAERMLGDISADRSANVFAVLREAAVALMRAEQGDTGAAERAAAAASELGATAQGAYWTAPPAIARATIELWAARPDAAAQLLLTSLTGADEDLTDGARLFELGVRAHADVTARDRDLRAASVVAADALLDRLARAIETVGATPPPLVRAAQATAVAERSRMDPSPAPETWAGATRCWDELGSRYQAAYTRWRHAEAVSQDPRGDRRLMGALLREAHTVAAGLGARPLLTEIEALARGSRIDLGVAPPDEPAASAAVAQLELTPRELQVLALLADGMTNREIAQQLVISDKTASVHVSHILSKLSVPNRAAAAAVAHRLGVVAN